MDGPYRLSSIEPCLLLQNNVVKSGIQPYLEVAGGTIFNEVQLWAPGGGGDSGGEGGEGVRPEPWAVLRGHEGSIMRVSWAADGAHVYSTSDDRTARVWRTPPRRRGAPQSEAGAEAEAATQYVTGARVTAFGHTARVWDCQLATTGRRPLLATAGEDCTVRLWDAPRDVVPGASTPDGGGGGAGGGGDGGGGGGAGGATTTPPPLLLDKPVAVLRGHRGRGVWRALALRAPGGGGVLVSAGADASIKLWDLSEYEYTSTGPGTDTGGDAGVGMGAAGGGQEGEADRSLEVFTGPALPPGTFSSSDESNEVAGSDPGGGDGGEKAPKKPKKGGGGETGGVSDSKGEYIRAVCLASPGWGEGDPLCERNSLTPCGRIKLQNVDGSGDPSFPAFFALYFVLSSFFNAYRAATVANTSRGSLRRHQPGLTAQGEREEGWGVGVGGGASHGAAGPHYVSHVDGSERERGERRRRLPRRW
jgi:hypothetical protein